MICTNDDVTPTLQEEVERLFRTTLLVFKTMLRKQQDGYTLTLFDEHLSDSSTLIAIIKQPLGYRMEEYVIHDRLEGENGILIVRKDGKSSLEFPESGTISPYTWVIVKGKRVSFNEIVDIEGEKQAITTEIVSNNAIDINIDKVNTTSGIIAITNKDISITTIPISNEMRATIYREEKMDRNKNPAKYHLKQVGDVLMNMSLLVMSSQPDEACKQVLQVVLKKLIQILPVQVN